MASRKAFLASNMRLGLVQGFYWMASCVFVSYLVRLLAYYGYSDYESGLVLAVSSLATMTMQPLLGRLADRSRSVKRLLVLCFVAAVLASALLQAFIARRLITCLLVFIIFAAFRSLINIIDLWSLSIGRDDPCFSYGFTRSFGAVFYAFGALFFGYAIDRWQARIIIPCFIALCLVTLGMIVSIKEPPSIQSTRPKSLTAGQGLRMILASKAYMWLLASYLLTELTAVPLQNYLTRKFEVLGAGDIYTGLSLLVMGLFQLPALLSIDKLGKRFKARTLMAASLSGIAIRCLIIGFFQSPLVVALSYVTELVAYGLYIGSILLYIRQILPAEVQYLGLTLYAAITSGLGGMLGNFLAGLLAQSYGVLGMMGRMTAFSCASVILFVAAGRIERNDGAGK